MAEVIGTQFDQDIAAAVALEQFDGKPPAIQKTLQNAENVYKAFLYLKKMYSMFPAKETILYMGTVANADFAAVAIPEHSNYIQVNSLSDASDVSIKINGMEYRLNSKQKESFPVVAPEPAATTPVAGDTVLVKGSASILISNKKEY